MEDSLVDVKATDERLFELYLTKCDSNHLTPSIKDYLVWLDENYA